MRVDVERDYLHLRYQIMVVIPDDELVAMDPTAYELVPRLIDVTQPLAVRDMVAILQIAAEWLQRHPEAEHGYGQADPLVDQEGVELTNAEAEEIVASSLPAPFTFAEDPPRKETWLDRWLKRRAAKGPK